MKLRIQNDSIRFRLNRRDVEELVHTGRISSTIHFGTSELRYTLTSGPAASGIDARYDANEIRIDLPHTLLRDWAASDTVGIEADQNTLHVLIEKDFQCMHKDESHKDPDAYPNPDAA